MVTHTMRAIVATGYGEPSVLQLKRVNKPTPKSNEVLIRTVATSATTADAIMRTGKPFSVRLFLGLNKPKHPIPGTGFAGFIEQIGSEVTRFKVGDAVFGGTTIGFSANAEFLVVPENGVILHKPEALHFHEAASFCDGHLTSYNFIKRVAHVQEGQKILINGAAGSLGTAAVQLAKFFGAHVTGVCSSHNFGLLKSLGADELVDYNLRPLHQLDETFDIIYDTVGKSSFSNCKSLLTPTGLYMSPVMNGRLILDMLRTKLFSKKQAQFEATGLQKDAMLRSMLEDVLALHQAGKLKTVIDRQYPLEKVADAHGYISSGHKKGNVVIWVADAMPI